MGGNSGLLLVQTTGCSATLRAKTSGVRVVSEWTVYSAVLERTLAGWVVTTRQSPWDDEHLHPVAFLAGSPELQIVATMKIQLRALLTWAQEGKVAQTIRYAVTANTVFFRPLHWRKGTHPTSETLCSFWNITQFTKCRHLRNMPLPVIKDR